MKTKLLLLVSSVIAVCALSSCDVYATPYGGGYGYGRSSYYRPSYSGYNRGYSGNTYYGNRCSGTTGTIVGGVAGAVLGSKIAGSRQRYDYYGNRRGGSNATGAIIGGAVGALLGRKVDKDSCNDRNYRGNYGYRY